MKKHGKHAAESKQGMSSKMLASALTAALTMSSVPVTALAMEDVTGDDGSDQDASEPLKRVAEDDAAEKGMPIASGSSSSAQDAADPEQQPSAVAPGDAEEATPEEAPPVEGADEPAADDAALADEDDAAQKDLAAQINEEKELTVLADDGAEEADSDEADEDEDAWVRPAAGSSISLAADNRPFVSETGKSTYYTYPVMQSCTSTLIDLPQITAYGTPPASGVDFAAEQGVAVADIVAGDIDRTNATPTRTDLDASYNSSFGNHYVFWKASLLDSAIGSSQALGNNSTQINGGQSVSRIRYNAGAAEGRGSWEYTADGSAWTAFTVGSTSKQLVFYYKQIAFLDENVNLTNDNDYRRPDAWAGNTGWGRDNQDAVCFLYQLYDENGNKIDIPATQAYYFSHANNQEVAVSLASSLADKYEVAKVSWDNYQEYIRGSKLYTETCPDFEIPQKFSMLSHEEEAARFNIDLRETACGNDSHASCTAEHRGLYVVGIMVRGIQSDQSITVKYWGGKTQQDAVQLGSQTVGVAGNSGYDWAASGYQTASELTVKSVLSYNGADVEQTVPLTLPDEYAGCYESAPYARVLEGNVLNLYFDADMQQAQLTSDPATKVYDGEPLMPAPPRLELPDGFTYTLDEGAIIGSQTDVGETVPVLDMSKVHIYKGEGGPEVTNIFTIEQELGSLEVTPREIVITPEDAEKTYGEPDPAFAAPAIELASPDDGKPAIIEGDDLAIGVVRAGGDEDVRYDAEGNVVAYPDVIEVAHAANPNYRIITGTADFTIWPQSIDPADSGKPREEGRYLGVVADPLADIAYNAQSSTPHRIPVLHGAGDGAGSLVLGDDFVAVYDGDTTNVTDEGVRVIVAGKGNYTGTLTIKNDVRDTGESYKITPAPAVIYVDDAVKHVGQADEDADEGRVFSGEIEGLIGDDVLGEVTYERTNAGIEDEGVYEGVLTAAVQDANANYTYVVVNGTFTILPLGSDDEPMTPPAPTDPADPGVPPADAGEGPAGGTDPSDRRDPAPEPEAPADRNSVIVYTPDGKTPVDQNGLGGDGYHKTYDGHEIFANVAAEKPGSTLLFSLNGGLTWTTENPRFTEVGTYTVTIKATHPDYPDTEQIDVDVTIDPRPVSIVVDDASKQYGDDDPAFTGTVPELVRDGDLGQISFSRSGADEEVGTYPDTITADYAENPNYAVTVIPGTLDITPLSALADTGSIAEAIDDDATPLASSFDAHDHGCWVHWWMILGLVLTALCTVASLLRRIKCIRRIGRMEGDVLESADLAASSRS